MNKGFFSPVQVQAATAIPGISHGFRETRNERRQEEGLLWVPLGTTGMSVHVFAAFLVSCLPVSLKSTWLWVRKGIL